MTPETAQNFRLAPPFREIGHTDQKAPETEAWDPAPNRVCSIADGAGIKQNEIDEGIARTRRWPIYPRGNMAAPRKVFPSAPSPQIPGHRPMGYPRQRGG